jgi:hypothetical protein
MHFFRNPVPAEYPEAYECGFEEEGHGGLYGKGGAENVSYVFRVFGPVHPELKFHRNPGDDPEDEIDEKQFSPEFRHPEIHIVASADIPRLHVCHYERQTQGERYEDKMKHAGDCKL